MKKFLATLLTLALIVSASFVLMVPASAAAADGVKVTLEDGTDAALNGSVKGVTLKDSTLTLENVALQKVTWAGGDLTVSVKGAVSIKLDAKGAIESTGEGNLTIDTAAGSKLTVDTNGKNDYIKMYKGNVTVGGAGEVELNGGQHPFVLTNGDANYDWVLNFTGSVKVTCTGTNNMINNSGEVKSVKINLSDSANLTIKTTESPWGYSLRLVTSGGTVITIADNSQLTLSAVTPQNPIGYNNSTYEFKAGADTDLVVKAGPSQELATEQDVDLFNLPVKGTGGDSAERWGKISGFGYVQFAGTSTKPPVDTSSDDTSSATDTGSTTTDGGNAGTSDSNLWVAAVSVIAVVAVAGVVVLSLRKKTND